MTTGEQRLVEELGTKSLEIANLTNQLERTRKQLQSVVAVLTDEQKEELGLADSG